MSSPCKPIAYVNSLCVQRNMLCNRITIASLKDKIFQLVLRKRGLNMKWGQLCSTVIPYFVNDAREFLTR